MPQLASGGGQYGARRGETVDLHAGEVGHAVDAVAAQFLIVAADIDGQLVVRLPQQSRPHPVVGVVVPEVVDGVVDDVAGGVVMVAEPQGGVVAEGNIGHDITVDIVVIAHIDVAEGLELAQDGGLGDDVDDPGCGVLAKEGALRSGQDLDMVKIVQGVGQRPAENDAVEHDRNGLFR